MGSGWVSQRRRTSSGAAGERRVCLPNTRFMIHQPVGGAGGQATDIAIQAKEILRTRERIARVIATQTGQPYDTVVSDAGARLLDEREGLSSTASPSRIVERQSELG